MPFADISPFPFSRALYKASFRSIFAHDTTRNVAGGSPGEQLSRLFHKNYSVQFQKDYDNIRLE